MMSRALVVALALVAGSMSGCPDDPVEPGTVIARYTVAPGSCTTFRLGTIEARVVKGDGTIENSASVNCTTASGEIEVTPVLPGSYNVQIRGFSSDVDPKMTFGADTTTAIRVTENGTATTDELRLSQLPSSVRVRWIFSNGDLCVDAQVTEVEINLLDGDTNANLSGIDPTRVPCENTFVDPDTGDESSGALFEDVGVAQDKTYSVYVRAFDSTGTAVQEGTDAMRPLPPSERDQVTVTLEPIQ